MIKKLLALALALTMCFGTTITANAAMNISNEMGALNTHNIIPTIYWIKTRPKYQKGHCSIWLQNSRLSIRRRILRL